jgi:hypothetical protein
MNRYLANATALATLWNYNTNVRLNWWVTAKG